MSSEKIQIFVSDEGILDVNPRISGYHLKTLLNSREPERVSLIFAGKPMKDDVSLDAQGVISGSRIEKRWKAKGGTTHRYTILFYIFLVIYALTFFTLLGTGVFNMIAYLYAYLLSSSMGTFYNWMVNFLGDFGIVACLRYPIAIFLKILDFFMRHGSVFLLLFVVVAGINIPIYSWRFTDYCRALYASKRVAFITAISFLVVYTLLNLPNFFYWVAILISNMFGTTSTVVTPGLEAQRNLVNSNKYFGFYMIPFAGAGITMLHYVISSVITDTKDSLNRFGVLKCGDSPQAMKLVAKTLEGISKCVENAPDKRQNICNNYLEVIQSIKNNRMGNLIKYASMGLNPDIFSAIEAEYKQAPFLKKIDFLGISRIGNLYFTSVASRYIFCSLIESSEAVNGFFDYVSPNLNDVIDKMKMGNIAGTVSTFIYIVVLIISLIFPSFIGI